MNNIPIRNDRPIVVVSACLLGEQTRYDGALMSDSFALALARHVTVIPFCPEVIVGLPVPRPRLRLIKTRTGTRVLQDGSGTDYTEVLDAISLEFIRALPQVDGFLLKSRSPSCGINDVKMFDDRTNEEVVSATGTGMFAREILMEYAGKVPVESEAHIVDPQVRHRFLLGVFSRFSSEELYPRELLMC